MRSGGGLATRAAALLLALAAVLGAWRATREAVAPPPGGALHGSRAAAGTGAFAPASASATKAASQRLGSGLAAFQEADGGFALWPRDQRTAAPTPEIERTASSALAAWALVELARQQAEADDGGARAGDASALTLVDSARDRALAYLLRCQAADPRGAFGRALPNALGARDPRVELVALAAGTLALVRSAAPEHAPAAGLAARALGAAATGDVPDGWPRGLLAMALEGVLASGRQGDLGPRGRTLLAERSPGPQLDCGDLRLAEAVVRVVRGAVGDSPAYPDEVLYKCLTEEPPAWNGLATDTASWLMQAWLAARRPGGGAWFERLLPALEDALGSRQDVPRSDYSDRVVQTACAALALAQGLSLPVAR